jgi:CheY-like chemotaxis protein
MENFLIIDDDPFFLEYVEMTLLDSGYSCLSARNGTEGLNMLRKNNNIRLIISDMQMPPGEWGGLWLIEQLKEFVDTPILILSEKGTVSKAVESIKAGAKDYVEKSKIDTDLIPVIEKILFATSISNNKKMTNVSSYFNLLSNIMGSTWDVLSDDSKIFIANAEQIYHKHANDIDFDFSVCIIELAKAIEVESNKILIKKIKEYFKDVQPNLVLTVRIGNKDILLQDVNDQLMLGQISYILKHRFIKDFCRHHVIDIVEMNQYREFLNELRTVYKRNEAAHEKSISLLTFDLLRAHILGIGNISPFKLLEKLKKKESV